MKVKNREGRLVGVGNLVEAPDGVWYRIEDLTPTRAHVTPRGEPGRLRKMKLEELGLVVVDPVITKEQFAKARQKLFEHWQN